MAVVKAWEQLLVLQLDLSLAVSGRAPQPLNPLSKAQPVQGMEQEESLSWESSFLSLGATSPTALGVGHRAGGCWWGRRLCGDMGDFVQEGMNEAGGILIQVNSSSTVGKPLWQACLTLGGRGRQRILWPQGATVGEKGGLRCSIDM